MEGEGVLKTVYDSASERAGFLKNFLPWIVIGAGLPLAIYLLVFMKVVSLFGMKQGISDFMSGAGVEALTPVALFALFLTCLLWLVGAALRFR